MKVLTAEQMQALDRCAIDDVGIPGVVLMENAGRCVANEIVQRYTDAGRSRRALILAGKGNNGGDGYVVARYLQNCGWEVLTLVVAEREAIRGDAAVHLSALVNCGGQVAYVATSSDFNLAIENIDPLTVIVDALFGTGLKKAVQGVFLGVVEWINRQDQPVIAVDIPSGIDGSTGRVLGAAVKADLTVTFAFPKVGQVSYPGAGMAGELLVVDIGIPQQVAAHVAAECHLIDPEAAVRLLPIRRQDGHKGSYGHLLVVAGSKGKCGAAVMAAEAGLRGGAGLVTLVCPETVQPTIAARLAEVMTVPVADTDGAISLDALAEVQALLKGKQALALGPGLGTGETSGSLIRELIKVVDLPMVIDADGLNALCGYQDVFGKRTDHEVVLTPHPGEMARLAGVSIAEIQADRITVARDFAMRHRLVLVLKGARTLVALPDGTVHVNTTGHTGMASGGMGDVLTGLIGSLLAQGLSAKDAATLGVYLHGLAAERLLSTFGEAGLLATDVLYELPAARQALTRES